MKNPTIIYLQPTDNRKSFYNKCHVSIDNNIYTLYSYNTKIMSYNKKTHETTHETGYKDSVTTKRHKKAFTTFIETL